MFKVNFDITFAKIGRNNNLGDNILKLISFLEEKIISLPTVLLRGELCRNLNVFYFSEIHLVAV